METYKFHFSFKIGSLKITPIHIRYEQLPPVIAEHVHSNVSYEIHYMHAGRETIAINGVSTRIKPGMIYVAGPGIPHAQYSDPADPVTEYCLYLNCQRVSDRRSHALALFADTPCYVGDDAGGIFTLLNTLLNENRHPDKETAEMSEALIRQIIVMLTRMYRQKTEDQSNGVVRSSSAMALIPIAEDAFLYQSRDLTLERLSALLNLSVRQTQRFLKTSFGKTFSQKLAEARMASAVQMLTGTDWSITRIGEEIGFSSLESFSTAFKRVMGCSPRQYRKAEKKDSVE